MRGARTGTAALLSVVTVSFLSGCVAPNTDTTEPKPTTSTASPASATPEPSTTTPAATTAPIEDAAPTTAPDAATAAVEAAVAAVTAYCQPTRTKGEWMAALSPLLSDAGVVAYSTVDPATVPCTTYSGSASIRDGDDAYTFRVNVPTDAGVYEAYVARERASDPWRVERMAPPE